MTISPELPTYFIGHAGVGLIYLDSAEPVRENIRAIGREIQSIFPQPRAIIVVSGHFTADEIHGPGVVEGTLNRFAFLILISSTDTFLDVQ